MFDSLREVWIVKFERLGRPRAFESWSFTMCFSLLKGLKALIYIFIHKRHLRFWCICEIVPGCVLQIVLLYLGPIGPFGRKHFSDEKHLEMIKRNRNILIFLLDLVSECSLLCYVICISQVNHRCNFKRFILTFVGIGKAPFFRGDRGILPKVEWCYESILQALL